MKTPTPLPGSRDLFPELAARSYLAHCAISPLSAPVQAAAAASLARSARLGVAALGPSLEERAVLRADLAALIGAAPEDIALVSNTTTGITDIAFGLDWRPRERVILFEGEFPANVTPWESAARAFDLEIVLVPLRGFDGSDRAGALARLDEALAPGARLVAVSAVQFSTGLAMPLADIAARCRARGAELFVDAIQALGVVPIDVRMGIDYLAAGSHKWLMGAEGCAVLYVSPTRVERLVPRLAGWLSHEDPVGFLLGTSPLRHDRAFRRRADVFEGAAANAVGLAALGAAVPLIRALGVERIYAHVQAWHDQIEPQLLARGFSSLRGDGGARSGILSVDPPEDVPAQLLVRGLAERGVVVSAPENHVRLAPSWPNALGEVADVVAAIDDVTASLRPRG
jgi:selenocysteine lyase/cysteine desulfurase